MRVLLMAAALLAALIASSPTPAAPCAGFADVVDTDPFCPSIAWMKNRAITLGCGDGTNYCPADLVRRDQMAAFMWRLGFQNAFLRGGNAFGATAALGTVDNHWVDIVVNGSRVMSYRPDSTSPNIVGGHPNNLALPGFGGQTIAGGGEPGAFCSDVSGGPATRTCANVTLAAHATVGGGSSNIASGQKSTVSGGDSNTAGDFVAVVAGGRFNRASASYAIVGGGVGNTASATSAAVLSGSDNTASGVDATVVGGVNSSASGFRSLAAGSAAVADQDGCFVFSGWASGGPATCLGSPYVARFGFNHGWSIDYLSRRPDGGGNRWVYIGDLIAGRTIDTWIGAHLTDAGVWVNASSSQAAKTDFAAVDASDVLEKVAALPITTWRYREGEGDVRHIGPMAEDFHAAFDVGYGPHTIADLDARGVALAAIQGLHHRLRDREAELAAQRKSFELLEARLQAMEAMLLPGRAN